MVLDTPDLDPFSVAFGPEGERIVTTSHMERVAATGQVRHVAKVWPDMRRFTGLDDRRLWLATRYCPSVELRVELLGVSEARARAELARCQQKVAETQSRPPADPPADAGGESRISKPQPSNSSAGANRR